MAERKEKNQESSRNFPKPKPHQFSRLTLDEAIAQHKNGLLTAAGLLYHTIKIYRADGQKLRINNVAEFATRLQINPRTFYKAKAHLIKNGLIEEEITGAVDLCIPIAQEEVPQREHCVDTDVPCAPLPNRAHLCPIGRTSAQSGATTAQSGATTAQSGATTAQSGATTAQSGATTALKATPCKASSASSDIYSDIYQIFIKSLSDSEREKFLEFGLKKASALPNPPSLPQRWIEANWQELHEQFKNTPEATAAATEATDWTQHPDWQSWLAHMREGVPKFVALGTCFDWKKRRAIADWADERGLIWGVET